MGQRADPASQHELYTRAIAELGPALDRVAAGYEADPDKRRDLRQDIHLQLWRSFAVFDRRCSLKTWSFRVAHNTAVTYAVREQRRNAPFVSLDEVEAMLSRGGEDSDLDQRRALERLSLLILKLEPLDRQIVLSWLEGIDAATTAEITGLSPGNVAMKVHRIKTVLARQFHSEKQHV